MKKIFFAICFIMAGLAASAQVRTMTSSTYGLALDTVTSTAAHYMVSGQINAGLKKNVEIVLSATEISGTTGGTATVECSLDNSTWFSPYNSLDSTYSFTLTDVATAQIYRWQLTNQNARYYRVKVVGSGSVSVKIAAKMEATN